MAAICPICVHDKAISQLFVGSSRLTRNVGDYHCTDPMGAVTIFECTPPDDGARIGSKSYLFFAGRTVFSARQGHIGWLGNHFDYSSPTVLGFQPFQKPEVDICHITRSIELALILDQRSLQQGDLGLKRSSH